MPEQFTTPKGLRKERFLCAQPRACLRLTCAPPLTQVQRQSADTDEPALDTLAELPVYTKATSLRR
jgi:hypothetical protein